ncbi:MAG: hypothetical protein MRY32_09575 [Rickettsiales bacterium]|nr:hypothetical protein [Rickettsiales bacterium]
MAKKITFVSGAKVSVSSQKVIAPSTEMLQALWPPRSGEEWDQTERFNAARKELLAKNRGAIISFKAGGFDRMPQSVQPGMCFDDCDITSVSWDLVPKEVLKQLDFSKTVVESAHSHAAYLPQGFSRG